MYAIMIRIKVFSSFCSSEEAAQDFVRINDLAADPRYNRDYMFVTDDSYTHAILLNRATPLLDIPKDNVIGLAFEPPQFLNLPSGHAEYAQQHVGKYCIGQTNMSKSKPYVEEFAFQHRRPRAPGVPWEQRERVSMMISEKAHAPGHMYRHKLVQLILQSKLPVDIYGRGCRYYQRTNDPRIKGEFADTEEGLAMYNGYQYHICIENHVLPAYVSEKVTSALAYGTRPIYLGSPLMNDYVLRLTGNPAQDIKLIERVCSGEELIPAKVPSEFFRDYNFGDFICKEFRISQSEAQ